MEHYPEGGAAFWFHYAWALTHYLMREAITINPKFAPAYDMLSQILVQDNEKRPEALELAKKTAELEPGNLNHQVNVARILFVMDRMEEARGLGQRILAAARTSAERMISGRVDLIDRQAPETAD